MYDYTQLTYLETCFQRHNHLKDDGGDGMPNKLYVNYGENVSNKNSKYLIITKEGNVKQTLSHLLCVKLEDGYVQCNKYGTVDYKVTG